MDFCIEDSMEELEDSKDFSDVSFFSKNYVTFIDFPTFEEQCLTSYGYNNPGLRNLGNFSLQPKGDINIFFSLDKSEVKLR